MEIFDSRTNPYISPISSSHEPQLYYMGGQTTNSESRLSAGKTNVKQEKID